jgi:glucose/mannose-6-phosphate isomerase
MQKTIDLDQLEHIKRIDKSNMLGICTKIHEQCRDAIQRAERVEIPKEIKISKDITIQYKKPKNIIIAGMGGSAIGGEILKDWLQDRLPLPIQVCREYQLPAYVDKNTLVFAVSYSGNTEESLSAFLDAVKRRCMVLSVTSNGLMLAFTEKMNLPHVTIPDGMPPRVALAYLFFPLPILMEKMGILQNINGELEEVIVVLEKLSRETAPQIATENNPSKKLALELNGTIPVVYGFRQYSAVTQRLKDQFNENTKIPCKQDVFPELNHNEVMGWNAPESLTKQFTILLIRDRDEPPEIKNRIETTKLLALNKAQKILEIYARGKHSLTKMLSGMYIGDFASIYLAILQGKDPTPVETIAKIKQKLKNRSNVTEKIIEEIHKILS